MPDALDAWVCTQNRFAVTFTAHLKWWRDIVFELKDLSRIAWKYNVALNMHTKDKEENIIKTVCWFMCCLGMIKSSPSISDIDDHKSHEIICDTRLHKNELLLSKLNVLDQFATINRVCSSKKLPFVQSDCAKTLRMLRFLLQGDFLCKLSSCCHSNTFHASKDVQPASIQFWFAFPDYLMPSQQG